MEGMLNPEPVEQSVLNVTFGVYRFWRAYIDGYSALCVVYEVSLEVVMTTHA